MATPSPVSRHLTAIGTGPGTTTTTTIPYLASTTHPPLTSTVVDASHLESFVYDACSGDPLIALSVMSRYLQDTRERWLDAVPYRNEDTNVALVDRLLLEVEDDAEEALFVMPFLPREITEHILSFLTVQTHMIDASKTCSNWNTIVKTTPSLFRVASNIHTELDLFRRLDSLIARVAPLSDFDFALRCGLSPDDHRFDAPPPGPPSYYEKWAGSFHSPTAFWTRHNHHGGTRICTHTAGPPPSPFHHAAACGRVDVMRLLLKSIGGGGGGGGATKPKVRCYDGIVRQRTKEYG
eukprot:TRINITY_DN5122_c0_g3_i5.p1 TRINITY_DN5122_c0_g3~~TRINITY_DN5122_c0_g3_i5.p1  ORF type:complete len:294 (+),score=48.08 TRINITY_DN5122_c0_g3_i5:211-1092(+)